MERKAILQYNHTLPHQANKENSQGHKVWKPAPKAPGKIADVLKPSDTDTVGKCIHARRDRYGKVFVQIHALQLVGPALCSSGC